MRYGPGLYLRSAICTAYFKARRIPCSLVTCEGQFPRVYRRGKFTIKRRLGFGGQLVSVEIGTAVPSAYLHIGDEVYLNNGASVVAYCGIEIGDNTFIGDFVAIHDTNHHSMDPAHPARSAPIIIGSNVWLGRHVTVLPGSKIGDHTVVSAESVVRISRPGETCRRACSRPETRQRPLGAWTFPMDGAGGNPPSTLLDDLFGQHGPLPSFKVAGEIAGGKH